MACLEVVLQVAPFELVVKMEVDQEVVLGVVELAGLEVGLGVT